MAPKNLWDGSIDIVPGDQEGKTKSGHDSVRITVQYISLLYHLNSDLKASISKEPPKISIWQ